MLVYAATIALSAFLLFLVQPIVARQILPWFGGSAAVWTTCMVFFQLALLAGYFYSDQLIRRVKPRAQVWLHASLLLASLMCLPITVPAGFEPPDSTSPIPRILWLLTATIGLPYLMLATTGPLVQAWFSKRYQGAEVYRLYALSNLASMAALIGYPPLIEPYASGAQQSMNWSIAYAAFALLALTCGVVSNRGAQALNAAAVENLAAAQPTDPGAPSVALQALWLTLAALGSVLLLAITTHMTQNVASIPFLWVLPLALYLLTFILCFDGKGWYRPVFYRVGAALAAVLMLAGLSFRPSGLGLERALLPLEQAVPIYALGLFLLCMAAHGELVARKPAAGALTRFYLMVSLGGAVGGLLVGIVAPLVFDWHWELPLALTLCAALIAILSRGWSRVLGAVAAVLCLALFVDYVDWIHGGVLQRSRNFYGTLRVTGSADGDTRPDASRRLLHGVILHGEQYLAPSRRAELTTYYSRSSGVGRAIEALRKPEMRVGVIGLGVGTLAAYGRNGDVYRLYEINPTVPEVARSQFSFLADSPARIEPVLGDARLMLAREAPQRFDLLVVDAFSSDSIPVHLLTREAFAIYARHLAPEGALAVHITNRYLDLSGVVEQLGREQGWSATLIADVPDADSSAYRSDWIILTAQAPLARTLRQAGGVELGDTRRGARIWTDDHHNLFEVLR